MMTTLKQKTTCLKTVTIGLMLVVCAICLGSGESYGKEIVADYRKWEAVGGRAADESINLMRKAGSAPQRKNLIVLTNGGYAEVNGASTQGVLDGVSRGTGVTRGRNSLVEVHSAPWKPLWFAVYDKESGLCAYLQLNPSGMERDENPAEMPCRALFSIRVVEKVNAQYLYEHPTEFEAKCARKIFGGNEFRIVTIANAISEGAPSYVVRVLEFHDHFCPGVTSGIIMVNYLKRYFPPDPQGQYFVHAVEPWCKEDAFLVLLNVTPGKRSYAAYHPTKADKERVVASARDAATIVYRKNGDTKKWEGLVLAFRWPETGCRKTENRFINKLCEDLWFLKNLHRPDDFVKVVKRFELPEGVSPRDWARPGADPLEKLGLLKEERNVKNL